MKKLLWLLIASACAFGQQPQTSDVTNTQPLYSVNAKYVQGVGPGYWATAGSGLTLNISAGTNWCQGTIRTYAGGTLSMTNSTTNYVYLNPASSCVPAVKTSVFSTTDVPIAVVVASGGAITSITDDRTVLGSFSITSPGGSTGNLQYNSAGAFAGFADGTSTQVLHGGKTFSAVSLTADVTGSLPVANGGTGTNTLVAHSVIVGNGTSSVHQMGVVGTGNCLMDNGLSSDPTFQSCTGSSGVPTSFGALTDGSTVTWDTQSSGAPNASLAMNHATVARTLNLTNLTNGTRGTLALTEDSTGGAVLALGTGCTQYVVNDGGGGVTIDTRASAINKLIFTYDGTNCYWDYGITYSTSGSGTSSVARQAAKNQNSSTATLAVTLASNELSASTLLGVCGTWTSGNTTFSTPTDTRGNTWSTLGSTTVNTSNFSSVLYWFKATNVFAGSNVITFTVGSGGGHMDCAVLEYSGPSGVTISDFPASANNSTSGVTTSLTSGSTTISIVAGFVAGTSSDTLSGATGYTSEITGTGGSGNTFKVWDKASISPGTNSVTITGTTTGNPLHVAQVEVH